MLAGASRSQQRPIAAYGANMAPCGAGGILATETCGPSGRSFNRTGNHSMPNNSLYASRLPQAWSPGSTYTALPPSQPYHHAKGRARHGRDRLDAFHTVVSGEDTITSRGRYNNPRQRGGFLSQTIDGEQLASYGASSAGRPTVMSPVTAALALAHEGSSSPDKSASLYARLRALDAAQKN
jgi:hypothetical protein